MMDQRDRPLGAIAAQPGVQVRSGPAQLDRIQDLRVEAFAREDGLQEARALQLVSRRIGGVDLEIGGQRTHGFRGERVPCDRPLRGERRGETQQRDDRPGAHGPSHDGTFQT